MGAYYIVTDLVMRANFDLAVLDAELQRVGLHGGVGNYKGTWTGGYSSSKHGCRHPAEALGELLEIVENLSPAARDVWDRCDWRRFDMGFECYDERFDSRWQVKPPLLRRLVAVNGNLMVTIYRKDPHAPTL